MLVLSLLFNDLGLYCIVLFVALPWVMIYLDCLITFVVLVVVWCLLMVVTDRYALLADDCGFGLLMFDNSVAILKVWFY